MGTGDDDDLVRDVTYGAYPDDSSAQWTMERVPGLNQQVFQLSASVRLTACTGSVNVRASCKLLRHVVPLSCQCPFDVI